MLKIMFLCTGNSCRSQMAEGFARELGTGIVEAHSAGLNPAGLNQRAVKVMDEIGIDISSNQSKAIDADLLETMDVIITLCDHASESCPWTPPHIRRLHWSLPDPAKATGTEEEVLREFRKVRDKIRTRTEDFLKSIH
ncbi:MAG: arsenate reductase (thioredoxin) [Nitrospirae bacterium]|nr:arsenate reductase (thioredoxin) [Nitrospirota bacterium]